MSARHEILGGKVQLYKRGRVWHCSASVAGTQHRETTKRDELSQAEDVAEDWYLELRGKFKRGELGQLIAAKSEKTFSTLPSSFSGSTRLSRRASVTSSTSRATPADYASTSSHSWVLSPIAGDRWCCAGVLHPPGRNSQRGARNSACAKHPSSGTSCHLPSAEICTPARPSKHVCFI